MELSAVQLLKSDVALVGLVVKTWEIRILGPDPDHVH